MVKNGSQNPRNGKKWQAILFVPTVKNHGLTVWRKAVVQIRCHYQSQVADRKQLLHVAD